MRKRTERSRRGIMCVCVCITSGRLFLHVVWSEIEHDNVCLISHYDSTEFASHTHNYHPPYHVYTQHFCLSPSADEKQLPLSQNATPNAMQTAQVLP